MSQDSSRRDTFRPRSRAAGHVEALVRRLRAAGCVFAEDEAALLLDAATDEQLDTLVRRRVAGEPLETVLGWVDLDGHRLVVAPGVFVPRRRTSLLVDVTRRAAERASSEVPVLVELCAGVAPVAAIVARAASRDVEVHAAEIDPVAAACAAQNLPAHGSVHVGDLWSALPAGLRGMVDVLAANAPYVPTADIALMPPEAREHEPHRTLDGGADGLDLHRRIAADATTWLAPAGTVAIETSSRQAEATAALLADAGLTTSIERDDDLDATVVVGSRPGAGSRSCER